MKALVYTIFIVLAGTTYAQGEKKSTEDLYHEMADDMCDCVNKYANKISVGMRQAIIQSGMNPENMETIVQEQVMKDPEQGMKDVEAIMSLAEGMEKCGKEIDKKYKNQQEAVGSDSPEVVQQKLLEAMKGEKDCDITYALIVIGLYGQSAEEEPYYDEEYYDEEE